MQEYLNRQGINTVMYHGKMKDVDRKESQELWMNGEETGVMVIVATIAFGMGIYKPDVRYVIHTSMPASLCNYIQETG